MPLGLLGAVPVQAHGGGIVLEPAVGGVPDRGRQRQHGLPRVQVPGALQQGGQVDQLAVTFKHAVGEHEQTVTGPQIEVLHTIGVGVSSDSPKGWSTSQMISSTVPSRMRSGQG